MSTVSMLPLPFPSPSYVTEPSYVTDPAMRSPSWADIYNTTPNQVLIGSPKTPTVVPKELGNCATTPTTTHYFQFPPTPMTPAQSSVPMSSPSFQPPPSFSFSEMPSFGQSNCPASSPQTGCQFFRQVHFQQTSPPQFQQASPPQTSPSQIQQASPAQPNQQVSPHQLQQTSPHQLQQTSPHQLQQTSPHQLQQTSPHQLQQTSPHQLQQTSPHQLQQTSPHQLQQTSPHQLQQTSPHQLQQTSSPQGQQVSPPQCQPNLPSQLLNRSAPSQIPHQINSPQLQQLSPQQSVDIVDFPATHLELPPHLQTPHIYLDSNSPNQRSLSSPLQNTLPLHLPSKQSPRHTTHPGRVLPKPPSSAPPPYVPNLGIQDETNPIRDPSYADFLLQQLSTSQKGLKQQAPQQEPHFQMQSPLVQPHLTPHPQNPLGNPQTSHRLYTTGSPYGNLYYITHGKVKPRKRTAFTETQQAQLEEAFQKKNYISTAERVKLSKEIGLSVHTVLLWYQNKRARLKKRGIKSTRSESD